MSEAGAAEHAEWMKDHARELWGAAQSYLTREGLARAKEQGVRLGSPHLQPGDSKATRSARQARSARADRYAVRVRPDIEAVIAAGAQTLGEIARALTERGVGTPAGCRQWNRGQVRRVIARAIDIQNRGGPHRTAASEERSPAALASATTRLQAAKAYPIIVQAIEARCMVPGEIVGALAFAGIEPLTGSRWTGAQVTRAMGLAIFQGLSFPASPATKFAYEWLKDPRSLPVTPQDFHIRHREIATRIWERMIESAA